LVRFGFFSFQIGSNPIVLSTSPAISYNRSQVARGEDPFGLPLLNPCLQLHPTLQIRQKTQDPNISPRKHNHRNQSRLSYFKKKQKGSNTLSLFGAAREVVSLEIIFKGGVGYLMS